MRRKHPNAYSLFNKSSATSSRAKRPRPLPPPPSSAVPPMQLPAPSDLPAQKRFRVPDPHDMLLERALISATYRAAIRTPCTTAQTLSTSTNCHVQIKREDKQVGGTLLFRGAYNLLAATPTARAGVVGFGAEAMAVAAAAKTIAKPSLVIVPKGRGRSLTEWEPKVEEIVGTDAECLNIAKSRAKDTNRTLIDLRGRLLGRSDTDTVAGLATLGVELLQQCPHATLVFVAGGNSLVLAGIAGVLKRLGRGVRLIAVGLIEGAMDRGSEEEEEWAKLADDVVRVGVDEMCAGVSMLFQDLEGNMLEPRGALAVAGMMKYAKMNKLAHERVVCVVEKPVVDFDDIQTVAERSWRADGRRCVISVQGKSEGSGVDEFGKLIRQLGGMGGGRGGVKVMEIRWKGTWPMILGLGCDDGMTAGMHVGNLTSLGYVAMDLTRSDVGVEEMWGWDEEEDCKGEMWRVLRVEIAKEGKELLELLGGDFEDAIVKKVWYKHEGGGKPRITMAAKGSEWQLSDLEKELEKRGGKVGRVEGDLNGLRVLGCRVSGRGPKEEEGVRDRTGAVAENGTMGIEEDGREDMDVIDQENGSHVQIGPIAHDTVVQVVTSKQAVSAEHGGAEDDAIERSSVMPQRTGQENQETRHQETQIHEEEDDEVVLQIDTRAGNTVANGGQEDMGRDEAGENETEGGGETVEMEEGHDSQTVEMETTQNGTAVDIGQAGTGGGEAVAMDGGGEEVGEGEGMDGGGEEDGHSELMMFAAGEGMEESATDGRGEEGIKAEETGGEAGDVSIEMEVLPGMAIKMR